MRFYFFVIACFLLAGAAVFPAESSGLSWWFVDPLIKVFLPDQRPANPANTGDAIAARNQTIHYQIAVRSSGTLADVVAECNPLQGPRGASLTSIACRFAGMVVVGSHTNRTPEEELVGEAPGLFPDPLLPFPVIIEANKTRAVWITIHVPEKAAPGMYSGSVVLRSGTKELVTAPLRLQVFSARVPEERNLKVTNWFTVKERDVVQFFDIDEYTEKWWTLVSNYAQVMADYRQNVIFTPIFSLIVPQLKDGSVTYDFSRFDRWVEIFRKKGAIGTIEGEHILSHVGAYDAPLKVASVFQADSDTVISAPMDPDDPRAIAFIKDFLGALNRHLQEKGWKSLYMQHVLDEPHGKDPEYYALYASLVRQYLPGVRTIDAMEIRDVPDTVKQNSDIWVPLLGPFDSLKTVIDNRTQDGHDIWFYVCLAPKRKYMNRLIDYPLIKTRLLHWINFRYGLSGFLHWGWNSWTPEPYLTTQPIINDNATLLPPGDAFIVYPDAEHLSVYSSLRFEAMRAGIEDYEMLRALNAKNPVAANRLARKMVPECTEYVRDPVQFRALEKELIEALSRAQQ